MTLLVYAYYLFAAAYVILLPSYIIGKVLYPTQRLALRLGIGLVVMVTIVPTGSFAIAMLLNTYVSEVLLFSVASVITVAGLSVQVSRLKRKSRELEE